MSSLMAILSHKDLESVCLTRTGFGFALKAFHAPRNIDVALKLLTSRNATERDLKALLQEVASTQGLQCDKLMPPVVIYQFQGLLGVATEWMPNGSLNLLIHEHELYPELPFPLCMRILSDVAEGLNYLHSLEPPILHYSLKPSNVLLDLEYSAKISDYGLASWRRQQLRSVLQNCNNRSCWDLLYLSPEILQGGSFSQEGDVYSFGMVCWETLGRQKPLKGKTSLLEAVTGVCSGMRPGIETELIPNSLPQRNKLLQLIALCWHEEPSYRPHTAECLVLLQDILATFRKEMISDAIYNLIHAKDCAIDSAKSPISRALETDMRNLEVVCPQNNNRPNKEVTLKSQSLSSLHLESAAARAGKEASQPVFANSTTHNTVLERGHSTCGSKRSSGAPHSFSTCLMPDSSTGVKSTSPCGKESQGLQPPLSQLVQRPDYSPPYSNLQNNWPESPGTGPYCKERNCSILACGRETILNYMTEGRLNHLLDILRSQQLLSRMDYEAITSFPTLTGRARALLDTCLGLGEKAAQTVVAVLSASKGSPLLRRIQTNAVN
ncbi:receptor-interacting serine/threonine-protein kinase 2-like [Rhineura floridana]|uniref:receptor-interacting serine/threonine-protein kinase 2-like n=1 Tax=Rhineura floridana TaxID=261503 RepID=UPI002AC89223|nr:receptor-interacting serine/threonine-protein kinase 2-like [Rhineura floridana]XP_061450086.1 receptor-interacting serine/threonine-protein kinase 2-like [Rhineura floridana]XP_061450087.1 receptor-interacting serine/threonine-protein kinase 2-like [Rhineura floridana]XP_061450088.1 receptor-interacting serine/threonine-protein kinase 2-like [Rhineura floridana]XP_061450089.1 receptor-interacting serine/threonine-protein kinase 2-like [Rhineura floridana]